MARHRRPARIPAVRALRAGVPSYRRGTARRTHTAPAPAAERVFRRPTGLRRETGRAPRAAPPLRSPGVEARPRHLETHRPARFGGVTEPVRAAARGRGPGRMVRADRRVGEAGVGVGCPVHHRDTRRGTRRVPDHPACRDRADRGRHSEAAQLVVLRRQPASGATLGLARGSPGVRARRSRRTHRLAPPGERGHRRTPRVARALHRRRRGSRHRGRVRPRRGLSRLPGAVAPARARAPTGRRRGPAVGASVRGRARRHGPVAAAALLPQPHHPAHLSRDPHVGGRGLPGHAGPLHLGLARDPHPYARRRRSDRSERSDPGARRGGGSWPPASWSPPTTTRTASAPT